jgi:transposase-like protein
MSTQRYTPEFKDEAVRQVVERGYRVAEVAERLGVSTNSLHQWVKAVKPSKADEQAVELFARSRGYGSSAANVPFPLGPFRSAFDRRASWRHERR